MRSKFNHLLLLLVLGVANLAGAKAETMDLALAESSKSYQCQYRDDFRKGHRSVGNTKKEACGNALAKCKKNSHSPDSCYFLRVQEIPRQ